MEYIIKQLLFDDGDVSLQKVVDLENLVYQGKHNYTVDFFKRWYIENPMGRVVSFNAFCEDELVAHYACVPIRMNIKGGISLGLLDIFTVTHPEHRGRGLFRQLAQASYDYAKNQGFEFVIGVANANSFPGYMKYFQFSFISRLEVKMGCGTNIVPDGEKDFSVFWDKEGMNWRLNCGKANYSRNSNSILGQYNSFVQTYMGSFSEDLLSSSNVRNKGWLWRPRLYVGLGARFNSRYFKIPKFIKHSPFNLIFLDLTGGKLPKMTKDNVFFQLFDFDVA